MKTQYSTNQGDTFDSIAKKLYGNEKYFVNIRNANPEYMDVIVFSSGIVLSIPEVSTVVKDDTPTAPWRQ